MERLYRAIVRILRWSEKYTKTDMVYLSKGSFWLILGQGIQMASGLILAIAFANLLPKETYGIYKFVMSAAAILGLFTLSGMNAAIIRAVARGATGVVQSGFRTQMTWGTAIVLASGAVALYYYLHDNTMLATSFLIVGTFTPFIKGFGVSNYYLIGKKLFRESTMLGLWRKLIPIASILITLFLTNNPLTLILVYFASNAVSAGMLYVLITRRYAEPPQEHAELTSYSKHLSLMKTLGNLASNLDQVLIFHFLGAISVAVYSLAWVPVKHVETLFNTGQSVAFPKLSTGTFNTLRQTLLHKVTIATLCMALIALVYILAAPFLFKLLFPLYLDSVALSQVMALGLILLPRTLYSQTFEAQQMKRELYILRLSTPICRIGLLAILLPLYGMWGAVYAMLGAEIYATVLTHILFYRTRTD